MAAGALERALEEGQRRGLLGPAPVEVHIAHAERFAKAIGPLPGPALDLGSGGGLPGLVLALGSTCPWVLLDARRRSTAFLRWAVAELGLAGRVQVISGRAEELGHDPRHRGAYGLVTARGFGPPGVVAECGAPFLRLGGALLVSEPPKARDRWPRAALAELGLEPAAEPAEGIQVLRSVRQCPAEYPRGVGVPRKRPLF